jgi:hypothetical protein
LAERCTALPGLLPIGNGLSNEPPRCNDVQEFGLTPLFGKLLLQYLGNLLMLLALALQ